MDESEEEKVFRVRDCALITRMAGISSALNLRELRERVATCPLESLYHHFCETVIRASFDDPEFRNDLAVWSARSLGDRVLAERLGILNPYSLTDMENLREQVVDLIDDRLAEDRRCTWMLARDEFRFLQAATVVFDTGLTLEVLDDLVEALPQMSDSTLYYHFVEARRRPPVGHDDFSCWLRGLPGETAWLEEALASIDFYFLNLRELKRELVAVVQTETSGGVS